MSLEANLPLLPLCLDDLGWPVQTVLAQDGVLTASQSSGCQTPAGRFVLWDSGRRAAPRLAPSQIPLDVASLRETGEDEFGAVLRDEHAALHTWTIGDFTVQEVVAQVDRRKVRLRMLASLRRLVAQAGGIWVRKAIVPAPYRTAFHFRLDYDDPDPHDCERIWQQIERMPQAFSHFLCTGSGCPPTALLQRLQNHDVGSHGYWHHTYRNQRENFINIRRGIAALRVRNLQPSGFVAPHGRFNRALLQALEQLGITHSSEFALAYDELPFFPEGSTVLQIPIHPICLGILLEAADRTSDTETRTQRKSAAVAACGTHFSQTLAEKYRAGELMFLYGHPTDRLEDYPQVLERVLNQVQQLPEVWPVTFSEFARWWRTRDQVQGLVVGHENVYTIQITESTSSFPVALEIVKDNQVARLPLVQGQFQSQFEGLKFEPLSAANFPVGIPRPRTQTARDVLKHEIDWEKVTPCHALRNKSWRGWTKWLLRQLVT